MGGVLMLKRLQKWFVVMIFVISLLVSQTLAAFAADEISKGNYIFAMVLRSCGVCLDTSDGFLDQWRTAYEGYLTSTGNQSLLNQLKAYDRLSWGANASGIQALRENVQTWLSSNSNLITNDGYGYGCFYLPTAASSLSPQLPTSPGECVLGFPRFPDNESLPDDIADQYTYLFSYSDVFEGSNGFIRNDCDVYAPKGVKVIATYLLGQLRFYALDPSSGYVNVELKEMFSQYNLTKGTLGGHFKYARARSAISHVKPQDVVNFPLGICGSFYSIQSCLQNSNSRDLVPNNCVPLKIDGTRVGINPGLIANKVSVNDSMKLPSSSALAASCLSDTKKELGLKELSSSLGSGGLDVRYEVTYSVWHLIYLADSKGGCYGRGRAKIETFTGFVGDLPVLNVQNFPNHLSPENPNPDNITITENYIFYIDYDFDPEAVYPYTVEYYRDNELFQSVSKTVPMFGERGTTPRVVDSCEDLCPEYYLPDTVSSTSLPYTVSETNNVIKIHYQKDRLAVYPYTIEYYKDGEALKTISGTVPVFDSPVITSYENYCPEYYIVDDTMSTSLPYTVSKEDNVVKVYYKKDETARYPYTIEYYKDEELFQSIAGEVPVFGDTAVTSYEDLCPEYYLLDNDFTTALPYTVSKEDNLIKVYYKKDLTAKYSYRIEYYKDGQMFKYVPGTVPVFSPTVSTALSLCPSGYAQDTASSTVLPYDVNKQGDVIKICYVKKDLVLPYTVEYYKDNMRMKSVSANVSVDSPQLDSCSSYCPEYYILDDSRSTKFPYTVSTENRIIRIYYKKDESAVYPYTIEYYQDGKLLATETKTTSVFAPQISEVASYCPDGYVIDSTASTSFPYSVSKDDYVIKMNYINAASALPYTIEYYKDGKKIKTLSGNVPTVNPAIQSYKSYCPDGYMLDSSSSTPLPYEVTKDNHTIKVCYVPDTSGVSGYMADMTKDVMKGLSSIFSKLGPWLFIIPLTIIAVLYLIKLFKQSEFLSIKGLSGDTDIDYSFKEQNNDNLSYNNSFYDNPSPELEKMMNMASEMNSADSEQERLEKMVEIDKYYDELYANPDAADLSDVDSFYENLYNPNYRYDINRIEDLAKSDNMDSFSENDINFDDNYYSGPYDSPFDDPSWGETAPEETMSEEEYEIMSYQNWLDGIVDGHE